MSQPRTTMPSLLSISSHVVHGYVGNKAMVFPLQYLGWDADAINTTHFSNHPGYGSFVGKKTSAAALDDILRGLRDILDFSSYHIIITGYIPSVEMLEVVANELGSVPWLVDPVLGDNGKLYVDKELIPKYQSLLKSGKVTITTPNQFEFETLVGMQITSEGSLRSAITEFFNRYKVEYLVVSSVIINGKMMSVGALQTDVFLVPIEEFPVIFSGSGDLFCAMMAHNFYKDGFKLTKNGLEHAVATVSAVLRRSWQKVDAIEPGVKYIKDLDIVGSRDVYEQENDAVS